MASFSELVTNATELNSAKENVSFAVRQARIDKAKAEKEGNQKLKDAEKEKEIKQKNLKNANKQLEKSKEKLEKISNTSSNTFGPLTQQEVNSKQTLEALQKENWQKSFIADIAQTQYNNAENNYNKVSKEKERNLQAVEVRSNDFIEQAKGKFASADLAYKNTKTALRNEYGKNIESVAKFNSDLKNESFDLKNANFTENQSENISKFKVLSKEGRTLEGEMLVGLRVQTFGENEETKKRIEEEQTKLSDEYNKKSAEAKTAEEREKLKSEFEKENQALEDLKSVRRYDYQDLKNFHENDVLSKGESLKQVKEDAKAQKNALKEKYSIKEYEKEIAALGQEGDDGYDYEKKAEIDKKYNIDEYKTKVKEINSVVSEARKDYWNAKWEYTKTNFSKQAWKNAFDEAKKKFEETGELTILNRKSEVEKEMKAGLDLGWDESEDAAEQWSDFFSQLGSNALDSIKDTFTNTGKQAWESLLDSIIPTFSLSGGEEEEKPLVILESDIKTEEIKNREVGFYVTPERNLWSYMNSMADSTLDNSNAFIRLLDADPLLCSQMFNLYVLDNPEQEVEDYHKKSRLMNYRLKGMDIPEVKRSVANIQYGTNSLSLLNNSIPQMDYKATWTLICNKELTTLTDLLTETGSSLQLLKDKNFKISKDGRLTEEDAKSTWKANTTYKEEKSEIDSKWFNKGTYTKNKFETIYDLSSGATLVHPPMRIAFLDIIRGRDIYAEMNIDSAYNGKWSTRPDLPVFVFFNFRILNVDYDLSFTAGSSKLLELKVEVGWTKMMMLRESDFEDKNTLKKILEDFTTMKSLLDTNASRNAKI